MQQLFFVAIMTMTTNMVLPYSVDFEKADLIMTMSTLFDPILTAPSRGKDPPQVLSDSQVILGQVRLG
jgi:hypothetical protein